MSSPHEQYPPDLASFVSEEPLIARLARWSVERPDAPAYGFTDHSGDSAGVTHTLTWSQVARRVAALAARLSVAVAGGERVAILAPQGLDYVVGMLATLHTPAVAVPLFSPDLPGPSAEATAEIERIRGTGCAVEVVLGDITDDGTAAALVATAESGGTLLRGVVHAAGFLDDRLVSDIADADLRRVFAPKTRGAWRLHEATSDANLDWWVAFSSAGATVA